MRSLAVFVLVMLAGCGAPPPADDDGPQEEGDGGRTSEPGGRTSTGAEKDPPHDKVLFFSMPVDLTGVAEQRFTATVPANVTVVDFSLSWTTAAHIADLRVELRGCGMFAQGMLSSYTSGGPSSMSGRVCREATDGDWEVIIGNRGLVQGQLTLTGQIPKPADNATTSSSTSSSATFTYGPFV